MKYRLDRIAVLLLVVLVVFCLALMVYQQTKQVELIRQDAVASRAEKTVTRLRSFLRRPDSLVIHSVQEWDSDARTEKVVEVSFSAVGSDDNEHRTVFRRYYMKDHTTMDIFPTHGDYPNLAVYDPHQLFNLN